MSALLKSAMLQSTLLQSTLLQKTGTEHFGSSKRPHKRAGTHGLDIFLPGDPSAIAVYEVGEDGQHQKGSQDGMRRGFLLDRAASP